MATLLWYDFSETSGTILTDQSGNGNDGHTTDTPLFYINQRGERSQYYDTSYGGIVDTTLDISGSLTITMWIRRESWYGGDWQGLFGQDSYELYLHPASDRRDLNCRIVAETGTVWLSSSTDSVAEKEWYFVAVTYHYVNGGTLFINGYPDGISGAKGTILWPQTLTRFGLIGSHIFDGQIGDLKVFDTCLSSAEILSAYNSTKSKYQPLAETTTFQDLEINTKAKTHAYLFDTMGFVDKRFRKQNLIEPLYFGMKFEDELTIVLGKGLNETLTLTDKVSKYKQEAHETFRIEIWRNGSTLNVDQSDIESFEFTKVLTDEVGAGQILFDNTSVLDYREGDEIRIYYGSEGSGLERLVFTGEVDSVERFWEEEEAEQKLRLTFLDYGKLLLETKLTKSYPVVTNINTIITEILSGIKDTNDPPYPNSRKINLDHITSSSKTRTVDFVGESLLDCLGKLAFITQSEFYVDQNKRLQFFPRANTPIKATFGIDDFWDYNYEVNEDLLVNTVDVYGHPNKPYPLATQSDPDPWTDSLTNWSSNQGSKFRDTIAVRAGDYSINNDHLGNSPLTLNLQFDFPSPIDLEPKYAFKELVFAGKVVFGGELTSFPKLGLVFELEDTDGNKVKYPAEQTYDLLKTFESPSEGSWATDSAQHQTSSTSWVCHSTLSVSCASNERIRLNYVRDIIRNTWYNIAGYCKITYQFGTGSEVTIIETQTQDQAMTPVILTTPTGQYSCNWPPTEDETQWKDMLYRNYACTTYERFKLKKMSAYTWSSGYSGVCIRFKAKINGTTYVPLWEWEKCINPHGRFDIGPHEATGETWSQPGENCEFETQGKSIYSNQCCHKDLRVEGEVGTTQEQTIEAPAGWEPVSGGLGESLKVRFYYKVQSSSGGVYSKDRRIDYIKSSQVIPSNLNEIRIPVGPDAEIEGKWKKLGSDFRWDAVSKLNIETLVVWRNGTSEWARLIVDWLHFDKGKWFAKYKDTNSMQDPPKGHGVWFKEIFDDTIYSDTAASRWAQETINRYKEPFYYLRDAKGILEDVELWQPGDRFAIGIPETDDIIYYYQLRELTFKYDEEEGTEVELDFERLDQLTDCILNCSFETGDLSGWSSTIPPTINSGNPHSGTYKVKFDTVGEYIEQDEVNAPVDQIDSFSIWLYSVACPWSDEIDVIITYTDDTTTQITGLTGGQMSYSEVDLLSYLTAEKIVKKVRVEMSSVSSGMYVDDICMTGAKVAL